MNVKRYQGGYQLSDRPWGSASARARFILHPASGLTNQIKANAEVLSSQK
jgi:hypothetical protein